MCKVCVHVGLSICVHDCMKGYRTEYALAGVLLPLPLQRSWPTWACVFAYACLRIQEGAWMCMCGYIWLYVHCICSCTYVFFSLDMNICRFWKQIYLSVHICRGQVLPPSDAQSSVIGRLWHSEPPKPPVHPIRTRHLRYRATLVLVPNKFWSSLLTWLP